MNDPLPNTLSALILVAVQDARALDRNTYWPDYSYYHEAHPKAGGCTVCDAGAVMAGTLGLDLATSAIPADFPDSVKRKLLALDLARQGGYSEAIDLIMDLDGENGHEDLRDEGFEESPYHEYEDWDEFECHLQHMEDIARRLEALGY